MPSWNPLHIAYLYFYLSRGVSYGDIAKLLHRKREDVRRRITNLCLDLSLNGRDGKLDLRKVENQLYTHLLEYMGFPLSREEMHILFDKYQLEYEAFFGLDPRRPLSNEELIIINPVCNLTLNQSSRHLIAM